MVDHHLLIENKYKARKDAFYILHFTHLIKEIAIVKNRSVVTNVYLITENAPRLQLANG